MTSIAIIVYPPPQHIVLHPTVLFYQLFAADLSSVAPPPPAQPAAPIVYPTLGPTYVVFDANDNRILLANGQPLAIQPLVSRLASQPTAMLSISGTSLRLTQANAAGWPYSAGQRFTDADGNVVTFIAVPPTYAGGTLESQNTGGVRMLFKGLFCDFTAANLTALGTPLAAFAISGAIS